MQITHDMLVKMDACPDGVEFFDLKFPAGIDAEKGLQAFLENDKFDYCHWFLTRIFNRANEIRYARYAARQVLHIFEKQCPGNQRPRQAIEAAGTRTTALQAARATARRCSQQ